MAVIRIARHLAAALAASLALAAGPAVAENDVFTRDGVAIAGADPVAYFEAGEAVQGKEAHSFTWQGATWHFASAENRAAFAEDPTRYAPAFGGYCAYAVANGYKAKIDPEAWTISDGQLYLNYSKRVRAKWQKRRDHYIQAGHANWPELADN